MQDIIAARLTMAISLGFHIIFASIGMAMPFLMASAHKKWLNTGDDDAYRLTRLWMRGTAVFFATGAVSGTALSFELGLLWPEFMRHAGPIIGMPFSLEGVAFFVEAIALGLYMYGWEKLPPKTHWRIGVLVGLAGVSSGILVAANGWMNAPTGFEWNGETATNIDPIDAMLNPAWATQSVHMTVAAFQAVSLGVMGIHALLILRDPRSSSVHRLAIRTVLPFFVVTSLLQPMIGHWAAQDVAERQPVKLAAMEAHFHTENGAPLIIGGWPDIETEQVDYAIKVPEMLSFLAFNSFNAEVKGLDAFPRDE